MYTVSMSDSDKDALIALVTSAKDQNQVINEIGLAYLGQAMDVLARLHKKHKDQCVSTAIPNRMVEKNGATVYISPDKTVVSSDSIDSILKFFGKKTSDLSKLDVPENEIIEDWFNENYPAFDKYQNDFSLYNRDNMYSKHTNMYTIEFNNGRVLIVIYQNDVCIAVSPYVDG